MGVDFRGQVRKMPFFGLTSGFGQPGGTPQPRIPRSTPRDLTLTNPFIETGRLRPPSDLCEMSMDNSRPLAVLLPSTSGLGICSTALVFFLTMLHNEFNERYQNLTGGEVK